MSKLLTLCITAILLYVLVVPKKNADKEEEKPATKDDKTETMDKNTVTPSSYTVNSHTENYGKSNENSYL